MKKHILIYGVCGGVLILLLRLIEYRFLVIERSVEIYGGLIALLFSSVGMARPETHQEERDSCRQGSAGRGNRGGSGSHEGTVRARSKSITEAWHNDSRVGDPTVNCRRIEQPRNRRKAFRQREHR